MPDVRSAIPEDLPRIGRVLAAAFADDPVWNYMTSPRADWPTRAAAWFEAEARAQLRGHGEVLVDCGRGYAAVGSPVAGGTPVRGVAIWSPPGRWKGSPAEAVAVAVPSARLFRSRIVRALRLLTQMERAHPKDPPHWYLAVLGTDPVFQGAGVGGALMRAITDRCDDEGLGAYLESSKEDNVPYYARHGFEVTELIDSGGQPPTWHMWRDPR